MLRRIILLGSVLFIGASLLPADVRLAHDEQNVVASRLEGSWTTDESLFDRMRPVGKSQMSVSFHRDDSVAVSIPGQLLEKLGDVEAFSAGQAKVNGKDRPYLLIVRHGNPTLLFIRESNGEPMGDMESRLVMLAPAKDWANDLLLLGGDLNNEPFRPYKRVPE